LSDVEDDRGAETLVASAARRERVADAINQARAKATFVLCLIHWGDENTEKVSERQRELARWLIDHGVDAVAGSHSHCMQPMDFYHGRPVVYSLGNLVFDGAPALPAWNKGDLLEVNLGRNGAGDSSFRLTSIILDGRGFPHAAEAEPHRTRRDNVRTGGATLSRSRVQGASKNR
jgi:poly-gamma-glutamate synthesis protein (capsule biosynthesis protein)